MNQAKNLKIKFQMMQTAIRKKNMDKINRNMSK